LALKVSRVLVDSRVLKAIPEYRDLKDLLVLKVSKVHVDSRDSKVLKA